jgi:enterochelin esterase-like enzyme
VVNARAAANALLPELVAAVAAKYPAEAPARRLVNRFWGRSLAGKATLMNGPAKNEAEGRL